MEQNKDTYEVSVEWKERTGFWNYNRRWSETMRAGSQEEVIERLNKQFIYDPGDIITIVKVSRTEEGRYTGAEMENIKSIKRRDDEKKKRLETYLELKKEFEQDS